MITSLDADVLGVLQSQVSAPSYGECVAEVVQNSIDGGAEHIRILLDTKRLGFTVTDDGEGIDPESLENVGRRHYTSKCRGLEDLESLSTFGFRGQALAAIGNLSLLTVTSKCRGYSSANTVCIHNGKRLASYPADLMQGTVVSVSDLYGNTPVRKTTAQANLASVKQCLWPLLVASSVALTIYAEGTRQFWIGEPREPREIQVAKSMGINVQWNRVSAKLGDTALEGYIAKECSTTKCQYILVNSRLLVAPRLYNKVQGGKRKNGRPIFILRIETKLSASELAQDPSKCIYETSKFDTIEKLVMETFQESDTSTGKRPSDNKLVQQSKFRSSRGSTPETQSKNVDNETSVGAQVNVGTETTRVELSKYFTPGYKDTTPVDKKISRHALKTCRVLAQLHNAFIMVKLGCVNGDKKILVLIDQHSADERVNLEKKSREFLADRRPIELPQAIPVSKSHSLLRQWGVIVTNGYVTHMPEIAYKKCNAEYARNMVHNFVYDMEYGLKSKIRLEPETSMPWHVKLRSCPTELKEILNSNACRGAIKFGDSLTLEECKQLIDKLSHCQFPFQCAHGRPSVVPLVEL